MITTQDFEEAAVLGDDQWGAIVEANPHLLEACERFYLACYQQCREDGHTLAQMAHLCFSAGYNTALHLAKKGKVTP